MHVLSYRECMYIIGNPIKDSHIFLSPLHGFYERVSTGTECSFTSDMRETNKVRRHTPNWQQSKTLPNIH